MAPRKRTRFRWLLVVGLLALLVREVRRRRPATKPEPARPERAPTEESAAIGAAAPQRPRPSVQEPAPAEPDRDLPATSVPPPPEAVEEELSPSEAARILGCSDDEVPGVLDGQPATREAVERLALKHYCWRRHVDDPDSYWVTLKQASALLGVPTTRVKQLLETGEVPYVVHRDGVRLMRREELAPWESS